MDPAIVGDHVGHREDPVMALFGQHVGPGAGQCPVRRDQRVVHAVHPAHDPAHAGEVKPRRRGSGEDAGRRAGGNQFPHRCTGELHVGVEVQAGKRTAGRIAQTEGVRLARYRGLEHPHAVDLPGGVGGPVGTRVGDDDDVELAGCRVVEQPAQVAGDDGLLVVRRYDDTDHRIAHAAQNSRCDPQRTRGSEPAVHE